VTDDTALALLAEGRRRYEAGDYADAEPLARRAVELLPAAAGVDQRARAVAVQLLGECAYSLGQYREARELADQALALRAGASDAEIAESMNLQGIVDLSLGDNERGHERVASALGLRESALGPDAQDTLESLNNTGVALGRLGRMAEAIAMHEEALRRCERAYPEPTRELAVTCNALAVKLDADDDTRERATALYARAIEAAEAALGPEHPMVATLTSNIGTGRLNDGDLEAARPLLERALALHERRHGPRHPNTATVLVSCSALELRQGRAAAARVFADRALAIRLEAFGLGDRRTGQALAVLVPALAVLMATDAEVRSDAFAMLDILKGTAAGARLATADLVRIGEPDQARAEQTLRAYLARVAEREPAEDASVRQHRDRARMAALAADSALMLGQPDTAAFAASEAVAHLEAAGGPMSLELIEPLHRAAAIQRARHDDRRAVSLERRALDILATAYGDRHPFVLRGLALIASTEVAMGDRDAARRDLLRMRVALAGAEDGGLAAYVRGVVDRRLRALDGGTRLS
jgi:tetratricopeptide (TPR) repeat protein